MIWTVSEQRIWRNGFLAEYFQVIETAANGHFQRLLDRIEASNARSGRGEFDHHVEVKLLRAEVPMHYLVALSQERLAEVVNLGVRRARAWCAERGIAVTATAEPPPGHTGLTFTERMRGFLSFGENDYRPGYLRGRDDGTALSFRVAVDIRGVNRFLVDPLHEAQLGGWVDCEALGGRLPIVSSGFNLFVQQEVPGHQQIRYRIHLRDGVGHPSGRAFSGSGRWPSPGS